MKAIIRLADLGRSGATMRALAEAINKNALLQAPATAGCKRTAVTEKNTAFIQIKNQKS